MKYPASDKLEIIRLVEESHLGVKRTLEKIGVSKSAFYRWYDLYARFGEQGLEDRRAGPGRVWNRIPDEVRRDLVEMALERPELSPRELAVTFTDERAYFVSEASVYRLLKAHDLIASPAFTVIKAADEFKDKTTASNQLWQTDFTYLKVIGWGWFDAVDHPRRLLALHNRLEALTMKADDVSETLQLALDASGIENARVAHRPRLLSDNGSSYIAGDLEAAIEAFVGHYNYRRYHESPKNLTPADVYFGRRQTILLEREKTKRRTFEKRRLQHARTAA